LNSRSNGIAQSKANAYRQVFISGVHELLAMGFARVDRSLLPSAHEPVISGLICEAIENVFDDPASPDWVDDYEIHDDPPVHAPTRQGKQRRRVDIKIASSRFRPRAKFCFEAKRLNSDAGVAAYLGKEGLGQFTSASYAAEQSEGGMLAFVQSLSCDEWAEKIENKIDVTKLKLGRGGKWAQVAIASALSHTYQTKHKRPGNLRNIAIIHTLLDCT